MLQYNCFENTVTGFCVSSATPTFLPVVQAISVGGSAVFLGAGVGHNLQIPQDLWQFSVIKS